MFDDSTEQRIKGREKISSLSKTETKNLGRAGLGWALTTTDDRICQPEGNFIQKCIYFFKKWELKVKKVMHQSDDDDGGDDANIFPAEISFRPFHRSFVRSKKE